MYEDYQELLDYMRAMGWIYSETQGMVIHEGLELAYHNWQDAIKACIYDGSH